MCSGMPDHPGADPLRRVRRRLGTRQSAMAPESDSTPIVRLARVIDADAIADLHVRAWQVAYRGLLPDAYLDSLSSEMGSRSAQWRLRIAQPEPSKETLVAVVDDVIAGWVTYGPTRDEDVTGEMTAEIWGIYVDPDHWRRRAGSALLSESVGRLATAGYAEATLWVLEGNSRARRFYERHGWRPDGATDFFERGGHQAIEIRYRRPLV